MNLSQKLFKRLRSGSQCSTMPVAMTLHFRCMPRYIQFDGEVVQIAGPASLSIPCLNERVLLIREEKSESSRLKWTLFKPDLMKNFQSTGNRRHLKALYPSGHKSLHGNKNPSLRIYQFQGHEFERNNMYKCCELIQI